MKKGYVTFGQIHVHSVNGKTFDKDCVAVIYCNTYEEGRKKAFEYFDGVFHNYYFDDSWNEKDLEYYPRGYIEVNPYENK